jgi:hypothetical protein
MNFLSSMRSLFALILCAFLACPPIGAQQQEPAPAQVPAPLPPAMQEPASGTGRRQILKIFVLEGEGAYNNIVFRSATSPVVEVRDIDDRPVEGAEVVFRLPASGPGGTFPGQALTAKALANYRGQATAVLTPNNQAGRFTIHVTASLGNQFGEATINQTNTTEAIAPSTSEPGWFKRHWKLLTITGVATGAIIGVVLATGGSSSSGSSSSTPTVTISPGTITIGGPH